VATWRSTWPAFTAAPDIMNQACQLRGRPANLAATQFFFELGLLQELIVAKGTDLRDPQFGDNQYFKWYDIVEAPSSSNRFFFVIGVGDVAKGFTNEYRAAVVAPTTVIQGAVWNTLGGWPFAPNWPTPYP
jgi:hypothetical protein